MADFASTALRPAVPELVRTYRKDVIDALLAEARSASPSGQTSPSQTARRQGSGTRRLSPEKRDPGLAERAAAQRAAREAEIRAKNEEFRRHVERKMLEDTVRQEQEFQAMYQDVVDGLPNSSGIMGDTQYTLEHSARIKTKKRSDLYQEWDKDVFGKIQDRLQQSMDRRDHHSISQRLHNQMSAYLHTTNTKLGVFRDVIIEKDYNPLTAHDSTIRIATGDIRDPLKRDVLKPMYERQLMGQSAPSGDLSRAMLDTKHWGSLLIKATPYGHCMDETGNYVVRPASSSELKARSSRIHMDHYDFPNHDNQAAMVETEKGGAHGKAKLEAPGGGQRTMFGVLQQTWRNDPTAAAPDVWLDHKGKALPPGPEMRRGRANLNEIIQQTTNAYEDGRTLGDEWLERKGKAMPPGPEMRRGRTNLNEVFQQSSNPYQDGRTLGDAWLETKGKRPVAGAAAEVTIGSVISRMDGAPVPVVGGKITNATGRRHRQGHIVPDITLTTNV